MPRGGKGPPPGYGEKPAGERRRRNKTASEKFEVVTGDGVRRGPDLPDTHEWPQATLDWWETWRTCELSKKFTKTDWDFLLDTAVLHADFWLGSRSVAPELRLRVAKFGATPEDRARLKVTVGDPPSNDPPNQSGSGGTGAAPTRLQPKKVTQRRARLLKVVGESENADGDGGIAN